MKKYIVTGGAGFIGSNLIRKLNDEGIDEILVVDNLTEAKKRNLKGLKFKAYQDKKEFIEKLPQDSPDYVIHFGACTNTMEYNRDYLEKNNLIYSKKVFDYCKDRNIRLIYASSGSVYGDGSNGYSEDAKNLKPLNPYGEYKYIFDNWALEQNFTNWIALRFFNVFGPHEYHKGRMASVAYHAFEEIKITGKIDLFKSYNSKYKDGEQKRDFIYVKDVIDMSMYLTERDELNGIYNIGTGKARTFLDLANAIFESLNKEAKINFIEMPDQLKEKYQYFTEAKITKLFKTGYKEKIRTLEESINDYVNNYLIKL